LKENEATILDLKNENSSLKMQLLGAQKELETQA